MSDKRYNPPPGPPPNHGWGQSSSQSTSPTYSSSDRNGGMKYTFPSNNPWRETAQLNPAKRQRPSSGSITPEHEPQTGPPSIRSSKDVEMQDNDYEPPPGPPPGKRSVSSQYEKPQASLSSRKAGDVKPPAYDPWHSGPEGQLRPPPTFSAAHPTMQRSPGANADYADAERAHTWCRQHPLWPAAEHDPPTQARIHAGEIRLTTPPNVTDITLYKLSPSHTYIRTGTHVRDTIFLSNLPIYASNSDSPLVTGQPKTIYFEVHVLNMGDRYNENSNVECGIAIGFIAPPYPAWRLPGWHRGSLGVHSDDGRRYVDNSYGGQEFTTPFRKGDIVGIGMTFATPKHGDVVASRCNVFFTRNGRREGGWDLHEERDRDVDEGDITGLEGDHDLLAAVGAFGGAEIEAVFNREEWRFKP